MEIVILILFVFMLWVVYFWGYYSGHTIGYRDGAEMVRDMHKKYGV